jgi:hypothetical protein
MLGFAWDPKIPGKFQSFTMILWIFHFWAPLLGIVNILLLPLEQYEFTQSPGFLVKIWWIVSGDFLWPLWAFWWAPAPHTHKMFTFFCEREFMQISGAHRHSHINNGSSRLQSPPSLIQRIYHLHIPASLHAHSLCWSIAKRHSQTYQPRTFASYPPIAHTYYCTMPTYPPCYYNESAAGHLVLICITKRGVCWGLCASSRLQRTDATSMMFLLWEE